MSNPPPFQSLLALGQNEVQLWSASVDEVRANLSQFEALLVDDERERAGRYRFPKDHDLFIICRGLLRVLMSAYTGCPAAELRFGASPHGKPYLLSSQNLTEVHFNVSHSHGRALLGFCRHPGLGVDIEQIRPLDDLDGLANRYFALEECREVAISGPQRRLERFFSIWARKEAYLKATGSGLTTPLDSFYVTTELAGPPECPRYAVVGRAMKEGPPWTVVTLTYDGFAAAVSLPGDNWRIKQRPLNDLGERLLKRQSP